MSNNKRFYLKLLGIFMIEITNVTPEKIIKILWHLAIIILLICLVCNLADIIRAIR